VERRRRAEAVGDQGAEDLARRRLGAAALGQLALDEPERAEPRKVVGDKQQRPDLATDADERGSRRAKLAASRFSWPDAFSSSSRPRVQRMRWRTRPASSRNDSTRRR